MEYGFGSFMLDDKAGKVSSAGEEVKLRPQTFRLLETLIKSYPKILSRDQLIDMVWGSEHLSANSLPQAISELRQALGDDPQKPCFIETVHRRGYRFIGKVVVQPTQPYLIPVKRASHKSRGALPWLITVLSLLAAALLFWQLREPGAHPPAALPLADSTAGKALRLYYEGLYAERRYDPSAARELLAQAAALDPGSHRIRQALDQVDAQLDLARDADSASALLEQARLAYEQGDLERGQTLGEAALQRVRERGDRHLLGRALEQLARLLLYRGQAPQALIMLHEARHLHVKNADRRALARNRELEAEVLIHQGDTEGARAAAAAALAAWRALGDRFQEAAALQLHARLLARSGRFEEALSGWLHAGALFAEVGDRRGEATTAGDVAGVYTARGELGRARELLSGKLAFERSSASAREVARTLYSLAVIDQRTGRPEQARAQLEEALAVLRDAGDRMSACFVQRKLGDTLAQLGELGAARTELNAAVADCRALGHRIAEGLALANLGWLALHERDFADARRRFEAALALRETTSDPGNAADDQLGLAQLDLAEGRVESALERARDAAALFAKLQAAGYEAQAVALQARALAVLGRDNECRTAIADTERLLQGTEDLQTLLGAELDMALARAALGEAAAAGALLRRSAERARALGYGAFEQKIARSLAEIQR